jgi:hypothetical protein
MFHFSRTHKNKWFENKEEGCSNLLAVLKIIFPKEKSDAQHFILNGKFFV